jgi:hypothetical protein
MAVSFRFPKKILKCVALRFIPFYRYEHWYTIASVNLQNCFGQFVEVVTLAVLIKKINVPTDIMEVFAVTFVLALPFTTVNLNNNSDTFLNILRNMGKHRYNTLFLDVKKYRTRILSLIFCTVLIT